MKLIYKFSSESLLLNSKLILVRKREINCYIQKYMFLHSRYCCTSGVASLSSTGIDKKISW